LKEERERKWHEIREKQREGKGWEKASPKSIPGYSLDIDQCNYIVINIVIKLTSSLCRQPRL